MATSRITRRILMVAAWAVLGTSAALAQSPPPIKRTVLQTFDVPGTNFQTVIGTAEIAPKASIGRHTHPGIESGYLLEGEMVLTIEGQPDKPVKPGDTYMIAAGVPHDGTSGPAGAKVIATWIVEKGKPFAAPAP